MSESPTGWYQDEDDPGLARWWDGARWTEHTMAIPAAMAPEDAGTGEASPPEPSLFPSSAEAAPPLPPVIGSTRFPHPDDIPDPVPDDFEPIPGFGQADVMDAEVGDEFGLFGEDDADFDALTTVGLAFRDDPALDPTLQRPDWMATPQPAHRRPDDDGFAERMRGWPLWARMGLPILGVLLIAGLAIAAVSSMGGDDAGTGTTTSVPSSSTTAVTFLPLGPPETAETTSTTAAVVVEPTSTTKPKTTTTKPKTTTTKAPTTTAPTTTAPTTTTTAPTTTTTGGGGTTGGATDGGAGPSVPLGG